jgi:hypothetical protein
MVQLVLKEKNLNFHRLLTDQHIKNQTLVSFKEEDHYLTLAALSITKLSLLVILVYL